MSSLSSKEFSKSSMDLRSSSTVKQRPKGQSSSKPDWVYADETVTAESPKLKQRHPGKSGSDSEDAGSAAPRHNTTKVLVLSLGWSAEKCPSRNRTGIGNLYWA